MMRKIQLTVACVARKLSILKSSFVVLTGLVLAICSVPANSASAQGRFAVVHVINKTSGPMSFYRQWVWNYGTPQAKTHINWKVSKIAPGKSATVYYTYQAAAAKSPDLIVVFDSDRNKGAHWQMVKLTKAQSPDKSDRRRGYTYELRYDSPRKEYASLRPANGGRVTILDRKMPRPPKVN